MIDVDPSLTTVDVIGDSIVNRLVAMSKETSASSTSSSSLGSIPLCWASTSTDPCHIGMCHHMSCPNSALLILHIAHGRLNIPP